MASGEAQARRGNDPLPPDVNRRRRYHSRRRWPPAPWQWWHRWWRFILCLFPSRNRVGNASVSAQGLSNPRYSGVRIRTAFDDRSFVQTGTVTASCSSAQCSSAHAKKFPGATRKRAGRSRILQRRESTLCVFNAACAHSASTKVSPQVMSSSCTRGIKRASCAKCRVIRCRE